MARDFESDHSCSKGYGTAVKTTVIRERKHPNSVNPSRLIKLQIMQNIKPQLISVPPLFLVPFELPSQ